MQAARPKRELRREVPSPALISRSDIVWHGVWLGVLADLLAAMLFSMSAFIPDYLGGSLPPQQSPVAWVALVFALGTFILLLLPAMAGGALVGLVLARLRARPHPCPIMILVGAGTTLIVTFVALRMIGLVLRHPPLALGSINAVAPGHSLPCWRLSRLAYGHVVETSGTGHGIATRPSRAAI